MANGSTYSPPLPPIGLTYTFSLLIVVVCKPLGSKTREKNKYKNDCRMRVGLFVTKAAVTNDAVKAHLLLIISNQNCDLKVHPYETLTPEC